MATTPRRLTRTRMGAQFSEGSRLLWAAIAGGSQAAAALRVGCSKGMLTHWLYGDRRPSAEWSSKIESIFGVPASSWGRPTTHEFDLPAVEQASRDEGDDVAAPAATGTGEA